MRLAASSSRTQGQDADAPVRASGRGSGRRGSPCGIADNVEHRGHLKNRGGARLGRFGGVPPKRIREWLPWPGPPDPRPPEGSQRGKYVGCPHGSGRASRRCPLARGHSGFGTLAEAVRHRDVGIGVCGWLVGLSTSEASFELPTSMPRDAPRGFLVLGDGRRPLEPGLLRVSCVVPAKGWAHCRPIDACSFH